MMPSHYGGKVQIIITVSESKRQEEKDDTPREAARLRKRIAVLEQANALLEAREARYRELIEHAHDMIWSVDMAGSVTFLNSACETVTGYTKEELLGKTLAEMLAPENLDSARQDLSRKWTGEKSRRYEIQILGKDGRTIHLDVTSALIERGGYPAGMVAIARDVTSRRQTQEALRKNAENFEYLFSNHPMPMWVFDLETTRFLEVNQAAVEKYGYSRDQFLAMSAAALQPAGDAQRFNEYIGNLDAAGHGTVAWRHLNKSGRIIETEVFWRAVTFAGKSAVLAAIQDISDRKLLEEQLRQSHKLEAIGRLAGGVAHDFNNLLTVIAGYSQLLLNHVDVGHPMHAGLDQIRQSAEKAAILTHQLLAFSRRQSSKPGILDLNQIVSGMEKMLRRVMGSRIELNTRLSAELGRIQADQGQLEEVVLNLMLNARDAMPEGGVITVETASAELPASGAATGLQPGSYALLSVTDTGKGFDSETRGLLFDPFFTTKVQREGSGLGLSAVHGMVEQQGGFVRASSEPGKGARFEVYLPFSPDPNEMSTFDSVSVHGRETILVVDDETGVLRLICETLRMYGYRILESINSAEALEMAAREDVHVDLLLTDVMMPKVDGRTLADAWKARRPDLKVLFISGYWEGSIPGEKLPSLKYDLLQKPFSALVLARRVREALDAEAN
jgi:two-component system cell cycle sensor histidine kinase/response regulator CckA